jgi:catechol 2,3-dioxygenase
MPFIRQALRNDIHARSDTDGSCLLGSDTQVLLHLIPDASAVPAPRNAGLYHAAYLYPTRAALATAIRTYVATGLELQGAWDHECQRSALSELTPKGTASRCTLIVPKVHGTPKRYDWRSTTDPLDFASLLAEPDDAQSPITWAHRICMWQI